MHLYKISLFMFKVYHKKGPETFQEYFVNNYEIHNYRTRIHNELRVPHYRLDIMKQSVRVRGAYIWNFITRHVSHDCSLLSYKITLRKYILGNEEIMTIVP